MMGRKVVLVADFFGSLKARGIPAYVRDLQALEDSAFEWRVLRAPLILLRWPSILKNLFMVLHEQAVVPLMALILRPSLIVFPYNSASLLCSLSSRSLCVIHDLIPYRRAQRRCGAAYLYLLATTSWHALWRRHFAAASPHTVRVLRHVRRFAACRVHYLPNCFAGVHPTRACGDAAPAARLTLISGHSSNKDFVGAMRLYDGLVRSQPATAPGVDVVGFGDVADQARAAVDALQREGLQLQQVVVHGLLSQPVLDRMLANNAATWAHSKAEGFGRAVVEGRLAGRPVVMSRLAVFRPFSDSWCFAYANGDAGAFAAAVRSALDEAGRAAPYTMVDQLRTQAMRTLRHLLADG
jgi:hypothetical protein